MSNERNSKTEVIDLFNKLKSKYERRFSNLKVYKDEVKDEINYWCFLKALSEMPNCLQVLCLQIGEETIEKLEKKYIEERTLIDDRFDKIRRRRRKLTTVFGSKEVDLNNPY